MALISMSTFYPTFLSTVCGYTMAHAAFTTSITMIVVIFAAPLAGIFSDMIGSRKALFTWPFIVLGIMMLFPYTISDVLIILWTGGMGMAVLTLDQNLGMFLGPILFGALVGSSGWAVAGYWMIPILGLGLITGLQVKVR